MKHTFEESESYHTLKKLSEECGKNSYPYFVFETLIKKLKREELKQMRREETNKFK